MNTKSLLALPPYRSLWLLAVIALVNIQASAATPWSEPDPTSAAGTQGASGLWAGITAVYFFIYGVIWLIAAIIMARGWFKFKDGDQAAALYHLGGATGLALVPLFFQWIRSF